MRLGLFPGELVADCSCVVVWSPDMTESRPASISLRFAWAPYLMPWQGSTFFFPHETGTTSWPGVSVGSLYLLAPSFFA